MKKTMRRLLIAESIVFIISCIFFVFIEKTQNSSIDISMEEWDSQYIEYNNGWQIGTDWLNTYGETVPLIQGPYMNLSKGDYTATIIYECTEDQSFFVYADNSYAEYIKSEKITLDNALKMTSCDFRVIEDVEELEMIVYYNGQGPLSVFQITLERNSNHIKRMVVYLFALFVIINLVVYYRDSSKQRKKYIFCLGVIALLSSLPLFFEGLNDIHGHDLIFHLMRIEGITQELQLGNFPVRISSAWLGGYGYPTSIYYGDALLYIPAMLRLLGFNINEAYKIFVFIVNLLTVFIASVCFKKITKKQYASIILTLAYTTSSYRLLDIYVRSAVGEYVALMFLPLIMLAMYQIYVSENESLRKNFINGTVMAVGMTGIITEHILSAEMIAFAMAVVCLLCIKKTFKWVTIRTFLIAIGETLILSAAFLVPFVDYYLNERVLITYIVENGFARRIQMKGCNIGDYFDFFSNPITGTNTLQFNPGLILMITFGCAVILWILKLLTGEMKVCLTLATILMFMSTNLFPWDSLSYHSKLFNMLAQVQFPWRYVGLVGAMLTLLLGMLLNNNRIEKVFRISKKAILIICTVIPIYTTLLFTSYYTDYAGDTLYYDTASLDTYHTISGEYLRLGADKYVLDGTIRTDGIEYMDVLARKGFEFDLLCKTGNRKGNIVLPVFNYSGYVVKDEYGRNYTIEDGYNSCISFDVPKNFEGKIYLRFEEPWYWTLSLGISAMASVMLLGMGVKESIKRKKEMIL